MKRGHAVNWLARALALIGGCVLLIITLITCVSIIGRALIFIGLGPVPGDFELVEAGVGFAVFAFLPWCQINRGHASVDIFTNFLSSSINRMIHLVAEIVMAIAIIIIALRLWSGMLTKIRYTDTTFILQFPIWWAYAASLFAAVIACVVAIYMVFVRWQEVTTGNSHFSQKTGVEH
ncbi:MAG: TRAP transporter small permease [Rhizobiaceae bacterium]